MLLSSPFSPIFAIWTRENDTLTPTEKTPPKTCIQGFKDSTYEILSAVYINKQTENGNAVIHLLVNQLIFFSNTSKIILHKGGK